MYWSAGDIAQIVGGRVEGDAEVKIRQPARIEEAQSGSITFLADPAYESHLYRSQASAVLVSHDFQPRESLSATLIRVDDVRAAVGLLLTRFQEQSSVKAAPSVSERAQVHESALLGESVHVGHFSIIEGNVEIGRDSQIHDQVFIGRGVRIGRGCIIHPGVRILHGCRIGDFCTIHPNAVIGSDGFGFAPQADGSYDKVPQVGIVIIEDWVDVGSGTVIDRATMGATRIGYGVKLDNLIQIAHNVEIGENTVIAAQAGIAGSTKVGANCRIGGQVGIAGHLTIAEGTSLQAQSGVAGHMKEKDGSYMGSPALPYRDFQRSYIVFRQLPKLAREVDRLRKLLER